MSIWENSTRTQAYLDACLRASKDLDLINTDTAYLSVVNKNGRERYKKNAKLFEGCKNVIEIGGGYGGQCLESKIDDYTIIDLPEVLQLIEAFLKANGREADLIAPEHFFLLDVKPFDFLISDYAISELDDKMQWKYLGINAKHGKITGESKDIDRLLQKFGVSHQVTILDPSSRIVNKVITW